ncbi:MAG: hypothetical protein LBV31_03710 [Prevotellaceae bacterium]|nr:hypothetical protein [Prevotellaceae bacterium]
MSVKFRIVVLSFVALTTTGAFAQVTIGSGTAPDTHAVLDLKTNPSGVGSNKGFLPPRVELTHLRETSADGPIHANVAGMVVYNIGERDAVVVAPEDAPVRFHEGLYYNNGTKWVRLISDDFTVKWFYMPSIKLAIPATVTDEAQHVDLFNEFKKQFSPGSVVVNDNMKRSPNAPANIELATNQVATAFTNASFYYYVTDYDSTVFEEVSVSDAGQLSYKVLLAPAAIPATAFMNIVFVVK